MEYLLDKKNPMKKKLNNNNKIMDYKAKIQKNSVILIIPKMKNNSNNNNKFNKEV